MTTTPQDTKSPGLPCVSFAQAAAEAHADLLERCEFLALDAERRAEDATDQGERDNWLRIAAEWWSKS